MSWPRRDPVFPIGGGQRRGCKGCPLGCTVKCCIPPAGGLHFKQEMGVVVLRSHNSAAGISNDVVFPARVDLGVDVAHASRLVVIT